MPNTCPLVPSLDTSWLPCPTSVFFHHLWPGPVLSGRGFMLRVLCTVYKSIGDGYVWMLATLNLIKWKHGENEHKNFTQKFSEDFFTCLGCACVHDGLSTENPPKEQESNTALSGGREKEEQHRKKNSDLWRSGCFLYWSVGVMVTFWTVRSKGGSWKRGHWMAGKERRLLTSHCFSSFHQTSILYELKA